MVVCDCILCFVQDTQIKIYPVFDYGCVCVFVCVLSGHVEKNFIYGNKTEIACQEVLLKHYLPSTTNVIQMLMRQDVSDHEQNERREHAD